MQRVQRLLAATMFLMVCVTFAGDAGALTLEQCSFFQSNGKVAICHLTGSPRNPYVRLEVSPSACAAGHAGHPADFVAFNDPTCNGSGSLPEGAPCDGTIECGDGLSCKASICRAVSR